MGFYTIPFKLRFNSFDFDANVNLGTNVDARIRWNREKENGFAIKPIFGFGIASIKLDDANSDAQTATNVSAFTVNTGVLFINLGVTLGWDNISGNDQRNYNLET